MNRSFSHITRNFRCCCLASFMILISISSGISQSMKQDSVKNFKNVIRFNLSNYFLFGGRNVIFGYERVVSPSQSFSINFGMASIPMMKSMSGDSISIEKQSNRMGFNVSADYRFYLKKENRYGAPRGVYLGPYSFFNKMHKDTEWQIRNGNNQYPATAEMDFAILGMGLEMGYQFVVFKRLTIDMILIGPGIAQYKLDAKLAGDLTPEERAALLDKIQQALANKFPGMNLLFENKQIDTQGHFGIWSAGFRYVVHIGFRF
jgi:hypothetical protein